MKFFGILSEGKRFFKTSKEGEVFFCMSCSIFKMGRGLLPFFIIVEFVILHF